MNGLVTAKAAGTETITASANGSIAVCTITVRTDEIVVSNSTDSVLVGGTLQLTATTTPAGRAVTWTSSDTSIATVNSSGLVTGRTTGTVTITASSGYATYKCVLIIVAAYISLNKTSVSMAKGSTMQLTARTVPSSKSVSWRSSNTSVATVNSGLVTANTIGTATITASVDDIAVVNCYVTVMNDTIGLSTNEIYYIKNVWSEKYLDVRQGSDANYTEVIGFAYHGENNQKWKLELCDNNTYKLYAGCSSTNKLLDIKNMNVDIYSDVDASCQKFTIIRQEERFYGRSGQYYIKCGDKYLTLSQRTIELTDTAEKISGRSLWSFEKTTNGYADMFLFSDFIIDNPDIFTDSYKSWYDSKINGMGYTSDVLVNCPKNNVFLFLKSDSIWLHTGHGAPGKICFNDGDILSTDIDMLPTNELAGLRCFITLGCSSGAWNNKNQNIVQSIYDKGAQFALGFTHTQYTPIAEIWLTRFIDHSSEGYTIKESLQYADLVADVPFFGTGMKYYIGDDLQKLSR